MNGSRSEKKVTVEYSQISILGVTRFLPSTLLL
jgi:hypothetical protein